MDGRPCLCSKIQSTPRQTRLQELCVYGYCSMCSDNPRLCFCSIIPPHTHTPPHQHHHHNGNITHFLLLVVAYYIPISTLLFLKTGLDVECAGCHLLTAATHQLFKIKHQLAFFLSFLFLFSKLNTDPTTCHASTEDCQHCSEASVKNIETKKINK